MFRSCRSNQVAPEHIERVKLAVSRKGFSRQQDLADEVKLSLATINNFLNGKRIDRLNFIEICNKLGLDWQAIADKKEIEASKPPDKALDPNFVGRERAIADLNTLVSQGAKVIGIYGKGGIGKTTLAQRYFKIQSFKVLTLSLSLEVENITPVEAWIKYRLRQDFNEESESEFGIMLEQLKCKLQAQTIGVLVDNLESALDENGNFIQAHRRYAELLRMLAEPDVKSITLITSRERLNESSVNIRPYELPGLDEQAWQKFFEEHNIKFKTDSSSLSNLHRDCGGNAKAMQILSRVIQADFSGNLETYWQANKGDWWVGGELRNLVISQFNRLQKIAPKAHRLLCRLAGYKNVPTVTKKALSSLLWDVPKEQHSEVIQSLRDRALVEFCDGEYWLHSVILEEAIRRLRASGEWSTVKQKVADFYDALYLDYALTSALACACSVDLGLDDKLALFHAYALAIALDYALEYILEAELNELKQALQQLKYQLPDVNKNEEEFKQWWEANGQAWTEQLKALRIEHCNNGYD
jgi:transcriptional regulator with XRE-family HTH domain